jgi:triacylglycerol lipase
MELGELIQQAYAQYDAFEKEEPWQLSGGYLLKAELTYEWTGGRTLEAGKRNFDLVLRAGGRTRNRKVVNIPIGFLAERQARAYLVFRGTITTTEWIRNFGINLSQYPLPGFGKVHDGFLHSYSLVRRTIIESVNSLNRRAQLNVAGHSLGAALATLAVPDIENNTKLKVRSLYSFGSPRVGDAAFVKSFNDSFAKRAFRIVNTSDIVTSIPLPVPIAGLVGGYFSHVDTPVDMTIQKDDLEKNHCMTTYLSALKGERQRRGLFAHVLRKR